MAISEHETGSQTCTVTTEHTLNASGPETDDGLFQLALDVNALDDNGTVLDRLAMRLYEKVQNSSGTQRKVFEAWISGRRVRDVWESPPLILLHGWDWKILQQEGTGRAIPWSIRKIATASEHSAGSQTCTIGTEHTLTGAETTATVAQLWLDLGNLTIGDTGVVRVKSKARSGDTQRVHHQWAFSALDGTCLVTPMMTLLHDWDISIEQERGTGRTIPYSIRKLG